jgi:hypothetical protein
LILKSVFFFLVQPRILAFDRLVSLLLYVLSATCIAEVVGFALRSLLAVGGISGNFVDSLHNLICTGCMGRWLDDFTS